MRSIQAAFILGSVGLLTVFPQAESLAALAEPGSPGLRVAVDGRVELMSVLFRLAGNNEYNQARVPAYEAEVEKQFRSFAEHPAVQLASELRRSRGVSYDACMAMAVHITDAKNPELRASLDPWPEGLDRRWSKKSAERFTILLRDFVRDSNFAQFLDEHRSLYSTTEQRLKTLIEKEGHLEWFSQFFEERPQADFTLVPALLNGGCCYGARFVDAKGDEELFAMLGVWRTDTKGLPVFTGDMLGTVIHEFCHSYANPIVSRHAAELRDAGEKLYRLVADQMKAQAYGNSETMLREYLVRACVIRYLRRYNGTSEAARAIEREKGNGFVCMKELVDLLGEYEEHRSDQPGLDAFAPQLISFFNQTAERVVTEHAEMEPRRPKVVSIVPKNGAKAVDPSLPKIEIIFDRPMRDLSWSLVGGGPHFPELTGKPGYDSTRTRWTVAVKLKPEWDYQFMINSARFTAFRSEEGVPVSPVEVHFKTSPAK